MFAWAKCEDSIKYQHIVKNELYNSFVIDAQVQAHSHTHIHASNGGYFDTVTKTLPQSKTQ